MGVDKVDGFKTFHIKNVTHGISILCQTELSMPNTWPGQLTYDDQCSAGNGKNVELFDTFKTTVSSTVSSNGVMYKATNADAQINVAINVPAIICDWKKPTLPFLLEDDIFSTPR
ncbi:MAG: hypothetical protein LBH74_07295 [Nitrososphaerota archaeon]|uniref:hypothetical protein n=1 Tax=Candidatus Bathycorpusculum sp. TaxID=2994959 RepID=UPI00281E4AC5|nr:hypothetical protein [Candidatus Termitimicrobium sp.]MCL2431925.1 hypothetical protein [Candidatus Termitimicrobium sp.]MDR0493423.1 hypothetical protein [Nitrososphaerota archaeon]